MPLFTFAHGKAEVERLVTALRALVDEHRDVGGDTDVAPLPSREELRTEQAMAPRQALFARSENVKSSEAPGRVSAELVTPYAPGIPVLVPARGSRNRS